MNEYNVRNDEIDNLARIDYIPREFFRYLLLHHFKNDSIWRKWYFEIREMFPASIESSTDDCLFLLAGGYVCPPWEEIKVSNSHLVYSWKIYNWWLDKAYASEKDFLDAHPIRPINPFDTVQQQKLRERWKKESEEMA